MKKFNSKQKAVKNNYKISTFFTRINHVTSNNPSNTDLNTADDDLIPATQFINVKNPKSRILDTITNTDVPNKRKSEDLDSKPSINVVTPNSPPRKKFNGGSENIDINNPNTSIFHEDQSLKPGTSNGKSGKSPVKSAPNTPKKSNSNIASPKKTPTKSKSGEKLFNKSTTANGFNVKIIENFIKITPSKSSIKPKSPLSSSSSKRRQSLILKYMSPNATKSEEAQRSNEKTPEKSPVKIVQPVSHSKAKINLNSRFASNSGLLKDEVKKKDCPQDLNRTTQDIETLFSLDDSWENYEIEQYLLDLSTPQHCTVTDYLKEGNAVSLTVKCTKSKEQAKCTLEGFWIWSKINIGCTVHITAVKDNDCNWKITNEHGLLVYEPDMLISNTAVVGALFCKRQSVFKEKFMSFESENRVMIIGVLIHTLLQGVLKIKTANIRKIENMLHEILSTRSTIRMMFNTSLKADDLENELMQFVPRIVKFMEDYVIPNSKRSYLGNNWTGTIDNIQDIEENIWCTELGIKGKVDASILSGKNIMPVELKTGRARVSLEHRGQVMLYIIMMSKLGYNVSSGLLLYLRDGVLQEIPYNDREKRDLILLRNELTYFLTRKAQLNNNKENFNGNGISSWSQKLNTLRVPELPEPINHPSACEKCPYNVICCSYLKYQNAKLDTHQALKSVQEQRLSHLSEVHIQYFIHFTNLLELEGSEKTGKNASVIYTKTPQEREKLGKCITFLKVIKNVIECDGLYEHTFGQPNAGNNTFLTSGLGESSYIIVSTNQRPAIASGVVSSIHHNSISVILDRNLNLKYPNGIFHIDSYDSNSAFSFNFTSLSLILEASEQSNRLRRFIIDKEPPTFRSKLPKVIASKAPSILKRLNRAQQHAVLKACGTNDYLLIKGMPGAGKTATIVALIQLLVDLGNSVLITSHTHAAVDNVCVRLKEHGVKVLRLGPTGRIHSDIQSMSEYELTKGCKTVEQLEQVYNNAKVFAVTCIGTKHPVFNKRTFDFCIVDESTQVIQCSLFRAISVSKKFILIGDPDQLPPVVRNINAMEYGLSESLFERLQNPDATVNLNLNYRMNQTITKLANDFMYKGELLVANDVIGNAVMKIPNLEIFLDRYKEEAWLMETLDRSLQGAVKVLDTGPTWQNCAINMNGIQDSNVNTHEIAIVNYIITALIKLGTLGAGNHYAEIQVVDEIYDKSAACKMGIEERGQICVMIHSGNYKTFLGGVPNISIGVISPFTAQVNKLSSSLKNKNIDVNTVDQFQGSDKEIIIFSCATSRDPNRTNTSSKYHILEDRRRLNVAITRAKHKFILIGDLLTVTKFTPFKTLIDQMSPQCFIRLKDGENCFSWQVISQI